MGKLIAFPDFDKYLQELKTDGKDYSGTILDTNIMVSLTYEVKDNHDVVTGFLDKKIYSNGIQCYSNIVTTAEFINVYRRILLTENLADASTLKLQKASRAFIKLRYGQYKQRQIDEGKDLIFGESDLKKIRDTFPGVSFSGKDPWSLLTNAFLGKSLQAAYESYEALGIKYISPNKDDQKHLFQDQLTFKDVISLSSGSGLAIFDSMILNALRSSVFSFAISADADLAYATLVDSDIKDIVAPDSIVKSMKKYKFKPQ